VVLTLQLAGYSYKEIAERLGKTYTWVNRHLTEGRAELRGRCVRELEASGRLRHQPDRAGARRQRGDSEAT
jgi:DNA-directed RNA polymerase specialized sigma24 family protein